MSETRVREAARAILLTPDQEILLLKIRLPDKTAPFWIAPGGGIEAGETITETLERELKEEVGLESFELGPLLWRRQHTFDWLGSRLCQREVYHAIHTARFHPRMRDEREARFLAEFKWWRVSELSQTCERLTPLSLAAIVDNYLRGEAPAGPLCEEVIED